MEPIVPVTGNPTLDHWLAVIGLVMSVASAVASVINAKVRTALDEGYEIPALFLYTGLAANYCAFNVDKAAQIHRMLRGQPVTVVKVGPPPEEKPHA